MKNRKLLLLLFVLIFGAGSGYFGYKAYMFAMNKYHYLRERLDKIESFNQNNIKHYDFNYDWIEDNVLIAHAFGGKGTKSYTNALESFKYNYDLGHRVFEVDFDLTTDKVTICSHDEDYWRYITKNENTDAVYDYQTFKNTPLFTDYTPMDYRDVVDLLCEYSDIMIITDTKYTDEISVYQQFSQIVDYAKQTDPEVLDRIIPQIYNEQMLSYVENVYKFKSIIFTTYQIEWNAEDLIKFCMRSGIRYIMLGAGSVENDEELMRMFKSMNIIIGVHTVNDQQEASLLLDKGVDMIITDFLQPDLFAKELE